MSGNHRGDVYGALEGRNISKSSSEYEDDFDVDVQDILVNSYQRE